MYLFIHLFKLDKIKWDQQAPFPQEAEMYAVKRRVLCCGQLGSSLGAGGAGGNQQTDYTD